MTPGAQLWRDAVESLVLFAIAPAGTGLRLNSGPGAARDEWLSSLREVLPRRTPVVRVPNAVSEERLLGGLDLAATLKSLRPITQRGLIAEADRGILLVSMAERITGDIAAPLAAVLDGGGLHVARTGSPDWTESHAGLVLLDESLADENGPPAMLLERCAYWVSLEGVSLRDLFAEAADPDTVAEARALYPEVTAGQDLIEVLLGAAARLGIHSSRTDLQALRAARAAAAIAGRTSVAREDIETAIRLVLAPRALLCPEPWQPEPQPPEAGDGDRQDGDRPDPEHSEDGNASAAQPEQMEDQILAAVAARLPENLLSQLRLGSLQRKSGRDGRSGEMQSSARSGRRLRPRATPRKPGARIDILETIRTAAPYQRLRDRPATEGAPRLAVERGDLRFAAFKQRRTATVIFVVDASGSAAVHRLAEAKGAIEHLLSDCYARRDQVALLAFRGSGAELLLPPTRSLVRARKSLAALPGGGGTPIAAGLQAAALLSESEQRRAHSVGLVILTDGRANIALDGQLDRATAAEEARSAARKLKHDRISSLVIDISPRSAAEAAELAEAGGSLYLPMPHSDAYSLSHAVRANLQM